MGAVLVKQRSSTSRACPQWGTETGRLLGKHAAGVEHAWCFMCLSKLPIY